MSDETVKTAAELQQRLTAAEVALRKSAEYVAVTQPVIAEYNTFKQEFLKRAHQTAGALAHNGIIGKHEIDSLVTKLAEDPLRALDMAMHVAKLVQPDSLGQVSDLQKVANHENLGPWERLALFGDCRAGLQPENSGLVD